MRQHNWIVSAVLDDDAFAAGRRAADARRGGREAPGQAAGRGALHARGLRPRPRLRRPARWRCSRTASRCGAGSTSSTAARPRSPSCGARWPTTERELLELRDERSVAMARLERQAYWLERGRIDLDAWMRRRPLRLAFTRRRAAAARAPAPARAHADGPGPSRSSCPVKDGARYLEEVLDGGRAPAASTPRSRRSWSTPARATARSTIARRAGARVIEIAPGEFGHGRTRNLAAELAAGDAIAFLTQDATPASRRLARAADRAARPRAARSASRSAPTCPARTRAR